MKTVTLEVVDVDRAEELLAHAAKLINEVMGSAENVEKHKGDEWWTMGKAEHVVHANDHMRDWLFFIGTDTPLRHAAIRCLMASLQAERPAV